MARRAPTPDLLGTRAGGAIRAQTLLGGTFLVAVAFATIGETKGGLPPPRRYAAVVLLWFIFGLAAELGGQIARFTAALAALVTLAMGMGTAGKRALLWLGQTGRELGEQPLSAAERAGQGFGGPLAGGGAPRTGRGRQTPPGGAGGGGGFGG